MSVRHLFLVAVAAIIGCASGTRASGTSTASEAPRRTNFLGAAEVVAAHAETTTAYEAIIRLRPNWLASRGMSPEGSEFATVFIDGQQHGDIGSLRSIPAHHVKEFRYYDVTQAGATFGVKGGTGGVIELKMR
jgi:hypothetical protein